MEWNSETRCLIIPIQRSTYFTFSSVAQSCLTLLSHEPQHTRPPCPSATPGVYPNLCPLSWWYHPIISSSVVPFSSCLQSFPESRSFLISQFFYQVAKVLEFQHQHQSFQWIFRINVFRIDRFGLLACPRDSQESFPIPQFKSINSSALSFLYGLSLASIHDYWKDHSFEYMDLCWKSNVSAF